MKGYFYNYGNVKRHFLFLTGFTVVPVLELALLIRIGQGWGLTNTMLLVVLTGVLGAILLKFQGISILRRIDHELKEGIVPPDTLFDELFIFCGGVFLITPGIITDILGFAMLFPLFRNLFKYGIKRKIMKIFEQGETIHTSFLK